MTIETAYKVTKEEHHWTSEEKLKHLGYGEWVEEPDVIEFEYIGYEAMIGRVMKIERYAEGKPIFGGHLCGYVRIPDDHPYFRKKNLSVLCHGGITSNEAHEQHWIGFDCAHVGDLVPSMKRMGIDLPDVKLMRSDLDIFSALCQPIYRNISFCIQECIDIITQLSGMANMVKQANNGV